jgi:hypothetical protein
MNKTISAITLALLAGACAVGCATSGQEQQRALAHQQSSDTAASNGQYGIAGSEERKAEDAHHKATVKAIDEGQPLPPQTKPGDKPVDDQ